MNWYLYNIKHFNSWIQNSLLFRSLFSLNNVLCFSRWWVLDFFWDLSPGFWCFCCYCKWYIFKILSSICLLLMWKNTIWFLFLGFVSRDHAKVTYEFEYFICSITQVYICRFFVSQDRFASPFPIIIYFINFFVPYCAVYSSIMRLSLKSVSHFRS